MDWTTKIDRLNDAQRDEHMKKGLCSSAINQDIEQVIITKDLPILVQGDNTLHNPPPHLPSPRLKMHMLTSKPSMKAFQRMKERS